MRVHILIMYVVLILLSWPRESAAQSAVQVPESVLIASGGALVEDYQSMRHRNLGVAIARGFGEQFESEFKQMGIASHVHIEADRTSEYGDFLPPLFGLKRWKGIIMIGIYGVSTLSERTYYAKMEYYWVRYGKKNTIRFSEPYRKKYPLFSETHENYGNKSPQEIAHLFMGDLRTDIFKLPSCWKGVCYER